MLKTIIAAGLCALSLSATPAAAQDAAAGQCRASSAATADGFKDNVRTARELGSRAAVGRRVQGDTSPAGGPVIQGDVPGETKAQAGFGGGVRVAAGDVNGDTSTAAARMQCSNNLKQLGTANTDR